MKKILALMLWMVGSLAFGQSINGVSPSTISVDGSNTTAAKVLTLPQVQPTQQYNASATPTAIAVAQTSSWFPMNGNGAAIVEFASNTFSGNYQVQVSDNPTPVSTPGTNIYTMVQDTASYATGGQGAQTKNWMYYIREGYKWIRFICTPDINNAPAGGTLNFQVRLFGNPTSGDASRSYVSGVPWKQSDVLVPAGTTATTTTNYYDYKLPQTAHGFNLYTNVTVASGATTIATTVYLKDPTTGQLQSIAVAPLAHTTGFTSILINPGYAAPYPVATPPAGLLIVSLPVAQDIVVSNVFTGTGTTTYSQVVVPIQ